MMGREHIALHAWYLFLFAILGSVYMGIINNVTIYDLLRSVVLGGEGVVHVHRFSWGDLFQLAVYVLIYFDVARAPDADLPKEPATLIGKITCNMYRRMGKGGHRGDFHSVKGAVITATVSTLLFLLVGLILLFGWGEAFFFLSFRFLAFVFLTTFASFTLHLLEDSVTVQGIQWFGHRLRGSVRVGEDSKYFVSGSIMLSFTVLVVAFVFLGLNIVCSVLLSFGSLMLLFVLAILDYRY